MKRFFSVAVLASVPVVVGPAALAQSSRGEGDGFHSPASLVEQHQRAAGRSAIPQPGEGFPKALAFETEAPVQVPFVREGQVVPWQQAAEYLGGDVITVEGYIEDAFQVPNGPALLKFDGKNREAFYLAAFTRDWTGLKDPADVLYQGKTVRVTGAVESYRGNPQMVVRDPSQIEIVRIGR